MCNTNFCILYLYIVYKYFVYWLCNTKSRCGILMSYGRHVSFLFWGSYSQALFWLPRNNEHSFFQFSFSRSGSSSTDLVLSRIYPFQEECFVAHIHRIPFTPELSLWLSFTLCFVSSQLVGVQFQAVAPRGYVSSELSLLGNVLFCFELC